MIKGVVTKSTGSWYHVRDENNLVYNCRILGKFRLEGFKLTNPVAVGDEVMLEVEDVEKERQAIIKEILPRRNYVVRQSPRKKHFLHLLAANIDQAVLIVTIIKPLLKIGFIDRFLMMTEPYNIPVTIVFNKKDLYSERNLAYYEYLEEVYTKIGYDVLLVSAFDESDIDKLRNQLKNKISLVSGQSGVGKSTLVNHLIDEKIKTAEISEFSGKGQHTTTFAEMFDIDETSKIIDTPGIKNLSFNNFEVKDVAHNFREFFKYSVDCKYSNCTHRYEPSCAVKEAIEKDEIDIIRYDNYLQIIAEIEDQNHWERLKDM